MGLKIPASREELMDLYWNQGMAYNEIAKKYNRYDAGTIWYWFKKYSIPPRDKATANSLARIDRSKWTNEDGIWRPKKSHTLSYVLGVMKGDGGISIYTDKKGCSQYRVQFRNTNETFAHSFEESLKDIGLNPYFWIDKKQEKRHPNWSRVYCIFAHSMLFIRWYQSLTLDEIEQEADILPFLRGFYESEGCLWYQRGRHPVIEITNTDKKLLQMLKFSLEAMGYHPTLHLAKRQYRLNEKPYFQLRLFRSEEILKLLSEMNPCIKKDGG